MNYKKIFILLFAIVIFICVLSVSIYADSCQHEFDKCELGSFVEEPLKCKHCDYLCNHVDTKIIYECHDGWGRHVVRDVCKVCGNDTDVLYDEPCQFADGICEFCGSLEYELCSHPSSHYFYRILDGYVEHIRISLCDVCGIALGSIHENCEFVNGVCSKCGNLCPHDDRTNLVFRPFSENTHKGYVECNVCKKRIETEVSECDFNNELRSCVCGNHLCLFDQTVSGDDFLLQSSTCSRPALYFYSCVCGAKTTDISGYFAGEYGDHIYVDGICEICGYELGSLILRNGWIFDCALGNYNTVTMGDARTVKITAFGNDYVMIWGKYGDSFTKNYTNTQNTGDILIIKYRNACSSPDASDKLVGNMTIFASTIGNNNGLGSAVGGTYDQIYVPYESGEDWHYIILDLSELLPESFVKEGDIYSLDYLRIQDISMEVAYIAFIEEGNEAAVMAIDPDFGKSEEETELPTEDPIEDPTEAPDEPVIDIDFSDIKVDFMPLLFPVALILVCVIVISSLRKSNRRRRR